MQKHLKFIIGLVFIALSLSLFAQNGLQVISDSTFGDVLSLRKMDVKANADDVVYIAYYDAGFGVYENDNFTFFNTENSEIPHNRVNQLFLDGSQVYLATENGIAIYDNGNWEFPGGGLSGLHIESVLKEDNRIYALCSSDDFVDSLAIYNGNNWNFIQFPGFTRSFLNNSPMLFHDDCLYFGVRQEGLFTYKNQQIGHLLYNLSINDLAFFENRIWISLNSLNPDQESILLYNPDNQYFLGFSNYHAYEKSHGNKGATFSIGTDGSLNVVYAHQTQLIINKIKNNQHGLMIFPDQSLNNTRFNASAEQNGKIYISAWSYLPIMLVDKTKYSDFLSGFWSKNLKTLDINQVGTTVKGYGSMFYDGDAYPRYQVPIDSNTNSIYASGLWIGGYDQSDNLHLSAVRYGENPGSGISLYDFSPGPLSSDTENPGNGDTTLSNKYNRVWKIDRFDIEQFNYNYNRSFEIPDDMEDWPGNLEDDQGLAPFIDQNGDGIYDLGDGDYPKIRGDQMLWWLINDNTHPNEETGGIPLGVEMHHSLYGYRYDNPVDEYTELINYQTYLNVKIINRSTQKYDSVYIGVWIDGDIGNPMDDYIGCDVPRNSFYFYNGDDYDENFLDYTGYKSKPPVQTVTILNGPLADADGIDNDSDGIVDNECLKMSKFLYYNNTFQGANPAITDPFEAQDYYNYLTGRWKDGTPVSYGGNGHINGGANINIPCNYMFPGDTDPEGKGTNGIPQAPWSEETENNTPDDRRGLCSIGPFTMHPGESNEVDILFAYIPNNGEKTGNNFYQPKLDSLITWYNENRIPNNYEDADALSVEQKLVAEVSLSPNPAKDYFNIRADKQIRNIEILDINGHFIFSKSVQGFEDRINTTPYPSGTYLIRFVFDEGTVTRKLIIL
ncbi:MAG: T9SS type A sorting domain-containing protein [Bacteroidales bacterium]|jgi:hypothetical protein|nr:T9SS type A sorting domain-containing protein [Bacteroidales bacterium]